MSSQYGREGGGASRAARHARGRGAGPPLGGCAQRARLGAGRHLRREHDRHVAAEGVSREEGRGAHHLAEERVDLAMNRIVSRQHRTTSC